MTQFRFVTLFLLAPFAFFVSHVAAVELHYESTFDVCTDCTIEEGASLTYLNGDVYAVTKRIDLDASIESVVVTSVATAASAVLQSAPLSDSLTVRGAAGKYVATTTGITYPSDTLVSYRHSLSDIGNPYLIPPDSQGRNFRVSNVNSAGDTVGRYLYGGAFNSGTTGDGIALQAEDSTRVYDALPGGSFVIGHTTAYVPVEPSFPVYWENIEPPFDHDSQSVFYDVYTDARMTMVESTAIHPKTILGYIGNYQTYWAGYWIGPESNFVEVLYSGFPVAALPNGLLFFGRTAEMLLTGGCFALTDDQSLVNVGALIDPTLARETCVDALQHPQTGDVYVNFRLDSGSVVYRFNTNDLIDRDGDGVEDSVDNCTYASNPAQIDTDNDGYGNACDGDFDNNCLITYLDRNAIWSEFLGSNALYDMNEDGVVNFLDLGQFFNNYLAIPGPGQGDCGFQTFE